MRLSAKNTTTINAGCPFCLKNGKISQDSIVAQTPWAYLVREYSQRVPGTYQIVPKWHEMSHIRWILFSLSLLWLITKTPACKVAHNLSFNFGEDAGQTVQHVHGWVIPRTGPYTGKGLAYYVAQQANM